MYRPINGRLHQRRACLVGNVDDRQRWCCVTHLIDRHVADRRRIIAFQFFSDGLALFVDIDVCVDHEGVIKPSEIRRR